ncbi:HNH endonuclease [Gracilibacillus ureilyticus]
MDHKMPKSKGGLSTPNNCVYFYIKCNRNKPHKV